VRAAPAASAAVRRVRHSGRHLGSTVPGFAPAMRRRPMHLAGTRQRPGAEARGGQAPSPLEVSAVTPGWSMRRPAAPVAALAHDHHRALGFRATLFPGRHHWARGMWIDRPMCRHPLIGLRTSRIWILVPFSWELGGSFNSPDTSYSMHVLQDLPPGRDHRATIPGHGDEQDPASRQSSPSQAARSSAVRR